MAHVGQKRAFCGGSGFGLLFCDQCFFLFLGGADVMYNTVVVLDAFTGNRGLQRNTGIERLFCCGLQIAFKAGSHLIIHKPGFEFLKLRAVKKIVPETGIVQINPLLIEFEHGHECGVRTQKTPLCIDFKNAVE